VLTGVSFRLREGELCGLIGPNGSGKSTLLKAILDIGPAWTGRISLCGLESSSLSRMERARLVSFLPQEYGTASRLTSLEMVLLGRHPHREAWEPDSGADAEVGRECLELAGIADLENRSFAELSGGERRLVMLASALAQQPRILLLDEPGSSLDFRHTVDLWKLLGRLTARGITVLASTHELNTAARFLDSVLLLGDGRCRAFGTPAAVCTPDLLSDAFGVSLRIQDDGEGGFFVLPGEEARR
jgi:ABC-type cobalamin/Fe3+-siderophores transport system ATPase subunit